MFPPKAFTSWAQLPMEIYHEENDKNSNRRECLFIHGTYINELPVCHIHAYLLQDPTW